MVLVRYEYIALIVALTALVLLFKVQNLQAVTVSLAAGQAAVDPRTLTALAAACRDHVRVRFAYLDRSKQGSARDVDVEFGTRYAIPEATLETLTFVLSDVSPRTVAAMQNFLHVPDLF